MPNPIATQILHIQDRVEETASRIHALHWMIHNTEGSEISREALSGFSMFFFDIEEQFRKISQEMEAVKRHKLLDRIVPDPSSFTTNA